MEEAAADSEEVEQVAGGKPLLTGKGRRAVDRAVADAERTTGLQFCVYLGPAHEDTRAHAEGLFTEAGLHERPSVMLMVAPDQKKVEVLTAPSVRDRLPDTDCLVAVDEMTNCFARGEFMQGLVQGLRILAEKAGPGTAPSGGRDLPNVVE